MNNYSYKKKKVNLFQIPAIQLIFKLTIVLLLFSISRWLIHLFNAEFFHHLNIWQALKLYFFGMRFDLVVIAYANLPVILYHCLPSKAIYNKVLQGIFRLYFIIVNAIIVVFNMIDVIYFRFIGKRMTSEFFQFFGNSDENIWPIVGQVFVDYWFMLILTALFVMVLVVVANRTKLRQEQSTTNNWYFTQWMSLLIFVALTPIACRGGLQTKPVNMTTALKYADSQNVPIVLNTPFTIVKSSTSTALKEVHYYEPEEMEFSPIHYDLTANRFIESDSLTMDSVPSNVVVIILKNIGQEMVGYYSHDRRSQLTPFLDSLLGQSLTFNGMSNSRRSLEVLPAILASIPSMMENDFVRSPYADNDFDAYCQHLQRHGYSTIFMHGGKNGVQGFDIFSRRAGFSKYFGRTEYNDDIDYDGQWGIYDGPFLQYAAKTLNRVHEPFSTAIYTLSSRYPYKVPKDFKLPEESYFWTGFEKTVYYVDCSLRDFFQTASRMSWYDHTLFVITADYSNNEHFQPEYSNVWGMYSIPIAFYYPNKIKALQSNEIAQQIDLGPSILSALEVNDTLFSFGRNLFDTLSEPSFVSYYNLTYQYCDGTYLVQSDGEHPFGIFKPISDSLLSDNLIDRLQCPDVYDKLYRFLQEYNNRMINNELYMTRDDMTRDSSLVDTISQSLVP